ncbi:hypothetical protein EV421DRAFT_1908209 [Armillaria borealis]|uniref:Uncharacterized protein n=1 Tax=Armillaria borealis TaxID=47425 RepID=A0AA39MJM3_9AGAR|nr:hypothetical protein EV421DRAFT_1908209 [Armillaria borealis]
MATPVIIALSSSQLRGGFPLVLNFEAKGPGVYTYNIHFKLAEDDFDTDQVQPVQSQTQYDSPTEYKRWVAEEALRRRISQQNGSSHQDSKDNCQLQLPSRSEATASNDMDEAGQDVNCGTPGGLRESQTQYDSPTEYQHWVEQEASHRRLANNSNEHAEHPVASFLLIFTLSSFVTPKRPLCKPQTVQALTVESKLFEIGVELGEIVPDSEGESLEKYAINLSKEEPMSPLLRKWKRDSLEDIARHQQSKT